MDTQLIPCNCDDCGKWAIFEVRVVEGGGLLKCTHCNEEHFMKGTQKSIREFISHTRKFVKLAALQYPEFLLLKNPGDYIEPPAKG